MANLKYNLRYSAKLSPYAISICIMGSIASCGNGSGYVETLGKGLSDEHRNFVNERMTEVFSGERRSGKVRDLTNFDWDRVCLYRPYFGPEVKDLGKHPFYQIGWLGDDSTARLVFSANTTLRIVAKIPPGYDAHPVHTFDGFCHTNSKRFTLNTSTVMVEASFGKDQKREFAQFQLVD